MDGLGGHEGIEQLAFTGGGASAADIQAGGHAVFSDQDSAAGGGLCVFRLADANGPDSGDRYLHLRHSFGQAGGGRQHHGEQDQAQEPAEVFVKHRITLLQSGHPGLSPVSIL